MLSLSAITGPSPQVDIRINQLPATFAAIMDAKLASLRAELATIMTHQIKRGHNYPPQPAAVAAAAAAPPAGGPHPNQNGTAANAAAASNKESPEASIAKIAGHSK